MIKAPVQCTARHLIQYNTCIVCGILIYYVYVSNDEEVLEDADKTERSSGLTGLDPLDEELDYDESMEDIERYLNDDEQPDGKYQHYYLR